MQQNTNKILYAKGEEVFGDVDKFNQWLERKSTALGNITPSSLLDSEKGKNLVMAELIRIEHGVFS